MSPAAPTIFERILATAAKADATAALVAPVDAAVPPLPVDVRQDQLAQLIIGQGLPVVAAGQQWQMSNNALFYRGAALRTDLTLTQQQQQDLMALVGQQAVAYKQQQAQLTALLQVIQGSQADVAARFATVNAAQQSALAAQQLSDARDALQDAKDQLQDAALAQVAAGLQLTQANLAGNTANDALNAAADALRDARLNLLETARVADEKDIAALKLSGTAQALQLTALASGVEADRVAAVNAQATADAAKADAKTAKDLANAAQARADLAEADAQTARTAAATAQAQAVTATTAAATAQAKVDTTAAAVATVQTAVAAAQATATTALTEERALAARLQDFRAPVASITLSLNTAKLVAVALPRAYADTNYSIALGRASGGLTGVTVEYQDKTTTGFNLKLTNTLVASLAVPASTVDVITLHD